MARQKKDGTRVSFILENSVLLELKRYCDVTGQTKTTAVERILKKYIDEWEKSKAKES